MSWYQRFLYIPMMFVSKKLSSGVVEGLGSRNLIIFLLSSPIDISNSADWQLVQG
jgi:hypothetical protein